MILLDKPYVSELLINTIIKNKYPIVKTNLEMELDARLSEFLLTDEEAVKTYENDPLLYTNSENTISWINKHLKHTRLPDQVAIFKNKGLFRDMLKPIYPNFKYEKVHVDELDKFDANAFGFPLILKPAVGFFSMGIYVVANIDEWNASLLLLRKELKSVKGIYPDVVMNSASFLVEQQIQGVEYAVDAYFDDEGNPVVIDIYEHVFSSAKDVNDRAYFTSEKVILRTKKIFEKVLVEIGAQTGIRNFPMHIEFRITPQGEAIPIEANPLRFAGWCMTDMNKYAWGINPYEYFFNRQNPDWDVIFKGKANKQYNAIIADIPREVKLSNIDYIDYKKLSSRFSNLLHIHKTDFKTYPVFAFAFSETTPQDAEELHYFLHSDLMEYIVLKK